MNINYSDIFQRNVPGTCEIFKNSTVGIAGCGGLGSNAACMLARAGIGKLIIADFDNVEVSNLNRQHFYINDIGKPKSSALKEHLQNINPNLKIDSHNCRINSENMSEIFQNAEILIEAFDVKETKKMLIESWCRHFPDRHIVSASGISGLGKTVDMTVTHLGMIHICGDGHSSMEEGLSAPRVVMASAMQASVVLEIILNKSNH